MVYVRGYSMSLTKSLKVQRHHDLIKTHAMKEATFIRSTGDNATFIRSTGDNAVDMRAE